MNRFFLILLLILFSFDGFSQEESPIHSSRYNFKGGAGYFRCLPAKSNGTSIWLEGGLKLRTGFDLILKLQHSQANMVLRSDWGPLEGQTKPDIFYVVDLSFSRSLRISRNSSIEPALGFMFERSYTWLPPLEYINGYIFLTDKFGIWAEDLGFSFRVDYHYHFNSGFFLGFRAQGYYIMGCFVEGLALTPVFGVRF